MTIPEKLLKKWGVLYTPGDAKKMAEKLDGSASETFNRALRTGECRDDVFEVMAEFFKQKAEFIKEYL